MATLSFNGDSYSVDHAVKGSDYIHCYDANNELIVSFEGISDFSGYSYDGEYMSPSECLTESCNDVKYCNGMLKTRDGSPIGVLILTEGVHYGTELPSPGTAGRLFFKVVESDEAVE